MAGCICTFPKSYKQLMHHMQLAAGDTLISSPQDFGIITAYILLSLYPMPMQCWGGGLCQA